ncbi:MAG TPA: hypothetical protein VFE52_04190 [Devosia sp.]|nr:hypothetical protein [Devosia sp.]
MEVYDAKKSTTEVRQANRSLGNFWVLIVSGIAIVALFAIIFFFFAATQTPPTAN